MIRWIFKKKFPKMYHSRLLVLDKYESQFKVFMTLSCVTVKIRQAVFHVKR